MNCRDYIIEFEERGDLSEPARFHLTVCSDCKKMSEQQTNIWLLIDDFKPIAAPTDFDFHVKARIAQTKPTDFQKPSLLPVLRYVLPLSVAVLLLGVFVFNSGYFFNAPPIAQSDSTAPPIKNGLPSNAAFANQELAFAPSADQSSNVETAIININSLSATNGAKSPRDNQNAGSETAKESPRTPKPKIKNETEGGSRDIAVSESNVRMPLGINLNVNAAVAPNFESPKTLGDDGILEFLGIQTTLQNGKRTVVSLTENSPAARSGVKIGDVIEKAASNSLTVTRGRERIEITIR